MHHVIDEEFAKAPLAPESVFMNTLLTHPKTDFESGKALLRQAYQVTAGIFDYYQQSRVEQSLKGTPREYLKHAMPLAEIRLHPAERYTSTNAFHARWTQYQDCAIKEFSGMSWLEFISMSRQDVEALIELCEPMKLRRDKELNSLNNLK